ncbi:MAG: glycine betaine ABC transporter substrate-binding protein [Pseudomonadota bacterium]
MRRLSWLGILLLSVAARAETPIVIGSKNFTESYVLAEIAAQWLEAGGIAVERRAGFGGTKVSYEALVAGDIDVYPEYTGTIAEAIVQRPDMSGLGELRRAVAARGLELVGPLGFDNTYAMAVTAATARRHGLASVSDLAGGAGLTLAFSHEFLERADGWPGLKRRYDLPQTPVGIEHGLAYQALVENRIDVTDAYSTDGDIERYGLVLLDDDRNYFPDYLAVWLIRDDVPAAVRQRLAELNGALSAKTMRELNAAVVVDGQSFAEAAAGFVGTVTGGPAATAGGEARPLLGHLRRHLALTGLALGLATVLGMTLALATYSHRRAAGALLYVAGLIQTVPSIALLALMIPLLGIGFLPAVVALLLYALLPVLRSTLTALAAVDPLYRKVAQAMGMTSRQEFRHVLLPLALPHVLAGVRTASVISIGTATLAAFIGAGGLGQPIVTGLALNDTRMILSGAVPAALLALVTDFGFDLLERRLVPPHMRVSKLTR